MNMAESGSKPEVQAEIEKATQCVEKQMPGYLKTSEDNQNNDCDLECFKHDRQLIDIYCADHDAVCCSVCVEKIHSSCKNIKAIHGVATEKEVREELKALQINVEADQKRLTTKKGAKQALLEVSYTEKDDKLKEIREFRLEIDKRLDELEKKNTDKAKAIFEQRIQRILSETREIDAILTRLYRSHQEVKQAKTESVLNAFIHLKIAKECLKDVTALEKKMESFDGESCVKFYPNRKMVNCSDIFGHIGQSQDVSYATWHADVNVNVPEDDFPCEVSSFYRTNDGCIYITDYVNMRVKKMEIKEDSYSITDTLDLPSFPWGVCQIDEKKLLVTLKQACKVLVISLDEPMSIESYFDAGDKIRGIAYHDGSVYVCCGGSKIYNEGVGRLEVYSKDGSILRAYFEHFSCPSDIKISESGTEIYVSDAYNGLIIVDFNGHLLIKIDLKELDVLCGICKIGSSKSCIAGFKSNNIVLVNEENLSYKEILGITDGIEHPKALHFDEKESILFVSMGTSNLIKLFKLK